jgi:hypothetical protein
MKKIENTFDQEGHSEVIAPEITPGSALNSVSIHSMKLEIPMSAGSGAGRTPKFIKDFSYSLNKSFSLLLISETSFSEASLWSANAFSRSWIFCSLLLSVLVRSTLLIRRSSAAFEDLS